VEESKGHWTEGGYVGGRTPGMNRRRKEGLESENPAKVWQKQAYRARIRAWVENSIQIAKKGGRNAGGREPMTERGNQVKARGGLTNNQVQNSQ